MLAGRLSGDGVAVLGVIGMAGVVLYDAYCQGNRPLLKSQHCASARHLPSKDNLKLVEATLKELRTNEYIVLDNVLTYEQLALVYSDICALESSLENFTNSTSVERGDVLRYLNQIDRDSAENKEDGIATGKGLLYAQKLLRGVGDQLLQKNFTGFHGKDSVPVSYMLVPDEVQLSLYRGTGTFCEAHRDGITLSFHELGIFQWLKLKMCRVRVVTAILYLNPEGSTPWIDGEGGSLRLHLGADMRDNKGVTAKNVVDIAPKGGRLVIFNSQTVLHEVLPTQRDRYAISVFFTI